MTSLYCSNALQPDDFIKPKYLTEWCHLRLCHLLFFGKISIIYIFTHSTPLSLEQLSYNIKGKAGLSFHWLFLSRSHSWWYISTCWKHGSQFNGPNPKTCSDKTFFFFFYYHWQFREPVFGLRTAFHLACVITRSVFTFQPFGQAFSQNSPNPFPPPPTVLDGRKEERQRYKVKKHSGSQSAWKNSAGYHEK